MTLVAQPLTATSFAPFGDVIEVAGAPDKIINQGRCGRYHDLARLDFGPGGHAGISLFQAELRMFPYALELLERHPDGAQAFLPMDRAEYLVTVAPDAGGRPGAPQAFLAARGQGVNILRNTWHGVLAPISGSGTFAVVDRIGAGPNLEEHWFETPITIHRPEGPEK
ncbi:Ureidoglycolate hydrolase [Candidatus Rhodobacter oscarellae]|uniref:Ureidoglycolate hydrolase n=1 Tax=Candidatus Rhodobacter oscarellae TaxID=1675527 RepID=A0A0J9ECF9_9RHOB|nr:ureidoglycolate lyase [Candidatus Rhodobacter lobularis]KMW60462.1 Ureidoglycolate hydrolase [Candidatus Rhodobacter lobularis]